MSKYYISLYVPEKKDSGAYGKARHDVDQVLKQKGYTPIRIPFSMVHNAVIRKLKLSFLVEYFRDVCNWMKILLTVERGSTLVYQHPMESKLVIYIFMKLLKKLKKIKVISLIHDLYTLRDGKDNSNWYRKMKDIGILDLSNVIVCHNDKMLNYLVQSGISEQKIIPLGIFDYLYDGKLQEKNNREIKRICIAGNLSKSKCGYIYRLNELETGVEFDLFGIGYDDEQRISNCNYCGSYPADSLPSVLTQDFGLVWDGNDIDSCTGSVGMYTMYNNPHKVSLYLMSEMPVIIWKKAALADFVLKNQVGLAVDSLREIPKLINSLSDQQINQMKMNAKKISSKMRSGYYVNSAISAAELFLSNNGD